jgi:hypothetical protein
MTTHIRKRNRLTKTERKLEARITSYDKTIARITALPGPELGDDYHKPGSLKKKGK